MYKIFGSVALKHHLGKEFERTPKDVDIMCDDPGLKSTRGMEVFWTPAFEWLDDDPGIILDLDELYTIKVSHLMWDVKWEKHINDVMLIKKVRGGSRLILEFYDLLVKDWEERHGSKDKIKFDVPLDEFFNEKVKRDYDHEFLHHYFAFNGKPMHEQLRKDPNTALCDEDLWDSLYTREQKHTALEEIYVIATERYVLPQGMPPMAAKAKAFKDLVTKMSKGWFNIYLIEHAELLMKQSKEEDEIWKTKLNYLTK